MDVAMLVIAACGFLISLLTFIVLLIEKITKNKNRLTLVGL
ncbi:MULTISPECIES: putative holin-like toxin [Lactobacillales]|nr:MULTISPECIES: putative holin-like toxin [Lactobacillales]MDM7657699.1 putative holin-like toxin [Lactococcus lactis]